MPPRPLKYTPERADKLIQAIRVGATFRLACQYAGISEDTFARWRKGRQGAPADFAERVKEAEGAGAIGWLAVIEKAMTEHWQAAAWKLERLHAQDYGRQTTVNLRTVIDKETERIAAERGIPKAELLAELDRMLDERPA
jgi:hypothetical protein